MEDQLVGFELAVLTKSIGFGRFLKGTHYVPAFYSEDGINYEETEFQEIDCMIEDRYYRPTQSLLQKYLRETHEIYVLPFIQFENPVEGYEIQEMDYIYYIFNLKEMRDKRIDVLPYIGEGIGNFVTYNYESIEEAFGEGLKEAIESLMDND